MSGCGPRLFLQLELNFRTPTSERRAADTRQMERCWLLLASCSSPGQLIASLELQNQDDHHFITCSVICSSAIILLSCSLLCLDFTTCPPYHFCIQSQMSLQNLFGLSNRWKINHVEWNKPTIKNIYISIDIYDIYIEHMKSFIVYLLNCFSVNISAMFDKNALSSKTMAVFVLFVSVCLLQETWLKC